MEEKVERFQNAIAPKGYVRPGQNGELENAPKLDDSQIQGTRKFDLRRI